MSDEKIHPGLLKIVQDCQLEHLQDIFEKEGLMHFNPNLIEIKLSITLLSTAYATKNNAGGLFWNIYYNEEIEGKYIYRVVELDMEKSMRSFVDNELIKMIEEIKKEVENIKTNDKKESPMNEALNEGIGGVPQHPHLSAMNDMDALLEDINSAVASILKCYRYCDYNNIRDNYDTLIPACETVSMIYGQLKSSITILRSISGELIDYKNKLLHDFPGSTYEKK